MSLLSLIFSRPFLGAFAAVALLLGSPAFAALPEPVTNVEFQPLASATSRLMETLTYIGMPLAAGDREELERALASADHDQAVIDFQRVLDKYCLALVDINPESRVKVKAGPAPKELVQQGWRSFLVKVHNQAGVTAALEAESPNALPLYTPSEGSPEPPVSVPEGEVPHRFLDLEMHSKPPFRPELSGLELEYRVVHLYSRDVGKREATIGFNVGQGTQDIGFRNAEPILFNCIPAVEVLLEVLDPDGSSTTGHFIFKDEFGRVYPNPARRLAPDFFFHEQIYRHDGESILLPPGKFTVRYTRGPEYKVLTRTITVPNAVSHKETFNLERWIDIARLGWRSGDHHIHAAGCAHYESPAEGVLPRDMMRHILGEDLNVGCVLTWGPSWYFQKQFFEADVNALSTDSYVMRYDVEVSGFPSSHAGHLSLLRLSEDDYRGVERIEQWPSWDLPVLLWAREQPGAVNGFSHSGWGLKVSATSLPTFEMPPYDGIGANEYIVDVVHDAVDFISSVDTPAIWELNIWYHTLNCGFRTRISGETDFPCIYGERVGLGRVYVRQPEGPLDYDNWVTGLKEGRSYVSDGLSHLLDFKVNDLALGEPGSGSIISQLDLTSPREVTVSVKAAAYLGQTPDPALRDRPLDHKPYWHVERARIGDSRKVPVELVVNGHAVESREIEADGQVHPLSFSTRIDRSSWVALRIFPSSHTNPVFVHIGGKPIRASRRSARWCLESVDVCWKSKSPRIRKEELAEAKQAYDVARKRYREILAASYDDEGAKKGVSY